MIERVACGIHFEGLRCRASSRWSPRESRFSSWRRGRGSCARRTRTRVSPSTSRSSGSRTLWWGSVQPKFRLGLPNFCTDMQKKVKARLRDPVSWIPIHRDEFTQYRQCLLDVSVQRSDKMLFLGYVTCPRTQRRVMQS